MSYTRLDVTVEAGVGRLTLNQPEEYNRMPAAFWTEFPAAIEELDASGKVRALVIASTGKHFCAGMDLSVFTEARGPEYERGRAGEAAPDEPHLRPASARRRRAQVADLLPVVDARDLTGIEAGQQESPVLVPVLHQDPGGVVIGGANPSREVQ